MCYRFSGVALEGKHVHAWSCLTPLCSLTSNARRNAAAIFRIAFIHADLLQIIKLRAGDRKGILNSIGQLVTLYIIYTIITFLVITSVYVGYPTLADMSAFHSLLFTIQLPLTARRLKDHIFSSSL